MILIRILRFFLNKQFDKRRMLGNDCLATVCCTSSPMKRGLKNKDIKFHIESTHIFVKFEMTENLTKTI